MKMMKNPYIISTLIELGSKVRAKNSFGKTVLDLAKRNNNEVAIAELESALRN